MPSTAKKKWMIQPATGEAVEVTGTRLLKEGVELTVFDGDEVVASFRGFSSVWPA